MPSLDEVSLFQQLKRNKDFGAVNQIYSNIEPMQLFDSIRK